MARLVFWYDVETTGMDPEKCDIVELAWMVEVGGARGDGPGELIDKGYLQIAPRDGALIEQGALDTIGKTEMELQGYTPQGFAHGQLCLALGKHCNRYNRNDKMIQAGFNVGFDDNHLRALFKKVNDKFYGSWFLPSKIDVMTLVAEWQATMGPTMQNLKLGTLCKHFDIPIVAHNPISDIEATRTLYYRLKEEMRKC